MRLEWLEDILAVLDTGSLIRAADRRCLTQSAFSRRIKSIEAYIDVELFDRSRKPVQLKKSVRDQQANMQRLAAGLRELVNELKRQDRETQNHIVLVSQHAITTSIAADLIGRLTKTKDISVRLRSENRDECYALLMTKQADITVVYQSATTPLLIDEHFLEQYYLGEEPLIPVFSTAKLPKLMEEYEKGELAIINYPADVFLGQVVAQEVFPHLPAGIFIRKKAETALTLAALQFALGGVGLAWIPHSLASKDLASGDLTDLSVFLPSTLLSTTAIRMMGPKSAVEEDFWQTMTLIYSGI